MAIARAAKPKVDLLGREEGHAAFYLPPPRTLYSASASVRERRNNMQGSERGEGGSGAASGRWTRWHSGELRLMTGACTRLCRMCNRLSKPTLCEIAEKALEQQFDVGAHMWDSMKETSSVEQRQTRLVKGFNTIGLDPYPEDE